MILDEIAAKTRTRVEQNKKEVSLEEMRERALAIVDRETEGGKKPYTSFPFRDNLAAEGISFICEVKKASPSKGLIAENFPYVDIAKEYEQAGASAISVLTEPYYFQGKNEYLTEISKEVSIPLLRKDFTVDEYMIYEAKVIGASAVLLICAILDDVQLKEYLQLAHSLGLSALVEAHDQEEVARAVKCGAGIIGVNNRDLRNFTVDIMNSVRLRKLIPEVAADTGKKMVYVSESGIRTKEDIDRLRKNGTDAVLIGETFMRSPDKKKMFDELKGQA
jgi:indole-3-glycerol phosphate synthase